MVAKIKGRIFATIQSLFRGPTPNPPHTRLPFIYFTDTKYSKLSAFIKKKVTAQS